MEQLLWRDALKTDIDVIDRQHRGLVDMINASTERLADDTPLSSEELRLLFGFLKDYTEVHFSTEEALMVLCGLPPDYAQRHHHSHLRFLAHVEDMIDDVGDDAVLDGQYLLSFLGDWLIRHIQGEDQGLAQRLRACSQTPLRAGVSELSAVERSVASAAAPARQFAEVLAHGSAVLHASDKDVPALLEQGSQAALLIALDDALLPAEVLHANTAAARFFGCSVEQLEACSGQNLLDAPGASGLSVLMAEVLMHGRFAGPRVCVTPAGRETPAALQITHLMAHGRMAILVVLAAPAAVSAAAPAVSARGRGDTPATRGRSAVSTGLGGSLLSRHALFQGMAKEQRIALEQASQLISLSKGDVLFDQGDVPEGLYMVISGQVSLVVRNDRGAEKVLDIVHSPRIFADVEVFGRRPSPVFAQSLSATVLLMIPAADVRRIQSSSAEFACAVADHLGQRVLDLTAEIQALTLHSATERIIDHLLAHARMGDAGVLEATLPAQKKVIASYLNVSPATLSRAFQHMTDTGLITISRSFVTIPDRDRLISYREQGAVG